MNMYTVPFSGWEIRATKPPCIKLQIISYAGSENDVRTTGHEITTFWRAGSHQDDSSATWLSRKPTNPVRSATRLIHYPNSTEANASATHYFECTKCGDLVHEKALTHGRKRTSYDAKRETAWTVQRQGESSTTELFGLNLEIQWQTGDEISTRKKISNERSPLSPQVPLALGHRHFKGRRN